MSKDRRSRLEDIVGQLEFLKADIESIHEEEYEAYSNLPDGIQESERGEAMSENCDSLEQIVSDLDDVISNLNEIVER